MNNHVFSLVMGMVFMVIVVAVVSGETKQDSDADGVLDVDEVVFHSDPMNPDSDADGLLDGQELHLGTDPKNPDSDEDGVFDVDEVKQATDPSLSDAPIVQQSGASLQVSREELASLRSDLVANEIPITGSVIASQRKEVWSPEELSKIQAAYDKTKELLKIKIGDQARVFASVDNYFIDFDQ
ncbi:MAG: hypothetical protein Q7R96_06610 [Nanoarchaeota archaeon]|nr:hypothetical protein [Nanoarchaeota archaeon]